MKAIRILKVFGLLIVAAPMVLAAAEPVKDSFEDGDYTSSPEWNLIADPEGETGVVSTNPVDGSQRMDIQTYYDSDTGIYYNRSSPNLNETNHTFWVNTYIKGSSANAPYYWVLNNGTGIEPDSTSIGVEIQTLPLGFYMITDNSVNGSFYDSSTDYDLKENEWYKVTLEIDKTNSEVSMSVFNKTGYQLNSTKTTSYNFDGGFEHLVMGTKGGGYVEDYGVAFDNVTYSTEGSSDTTLSLSWNDQSDNEDGFRIYSNATTSDNSFTQVGSVSQNTESFDHASAEISTGVYTCYQIVSYNSYGDSSPLEGCTTP